MCCCCFLAGEVQRASSGVAGFAGGDEGGFVSDDVVGDEVVGFGGGGFVAPVAERVAFE
jgi:hypothetical protein